MQSESVERKQGESRSSSVSPADLASDKPVGHHDLEDSRYYTGFLRRTTQLLSRYGIETHGIAPVPAEERLETRWYQMFFVWFSANMNILTFSTGTVGPAFFSLGVNDSLIVIVIVDLVVCLLPAFFAVFGPKLGTRAMVQARFSWGYFGAIIPTVLNVFSMQGFLILNCIVGGQTLASLSSHLDDTLGIVIIGIISLVVRQIRWCCIKTSSFTGHILWIPHHSLVRKYRLDPKCDCFYHYAGCRLSTATQQPISSCLSSNCR